jgi:hypothetical protein
LGILGSLFGSDNFVNRAMNGVDSVVFTPQEKAEHFLKSLEHYEPFKIAQRMTAAIVGIPYVFIYVVSALMLGSSVFFEDPEVVKRIVGVSSELATRNTDTLGLPFALIVGFYFAGGMANGVVAKLKGK